MKARSYHRFSFVIIIIILGQCLINAQVTNKIPENNAKALQDFPENLIHYGDLIDVDVIGSIEFDWRGTLTPEGFLNGIDFIEEPIYALCRSEDQVALDIATGYSKLLRNPQVVVKILDRSDRATTFLYGAVKTPQRLKIHRQIFLNELLIVSGGITDKASGNIQIYRPQNLSCVEQQSQKESTLKNNENNREQYVTTSQSSGTQSIIIRISDLLTGNKEFNPQILNGDIVTVLEVEPIYLIGGVSKPQQISARSQITLSRAIASAGGLSTDGDGKSVTIYRRIGKETKIIEANLEKIKTSETEDILLKAFDIVEVAQTGREKRKFPPKIQVDESAFTKNSALPLRIID